LSQSCHTTGETMATIRKRLNKYQVQVRTQGQHISKSFNNLQDAKRWSVFNENKILLGTELQALSKKLSLKDLINKYIDEVTPLKKGYVVETQRLKRLLNDLDRYCPWMRTCTWYLFSLFLIVAIVSPVV